MHKYLYAYSSPINYTDPWGEYATDEDYDKIRINQDSLKDVDRARQILFNAFCSEYGRWSPRAVSASDPESIRKYSAIREKIAHYITLGKKDLSEDQVRFEITQFYNRFFPDDAPQNQFGFNYLQNRGQVKAALEAEEKGEPDFTNWKVFPGSQLSKEIQARQKENQEARIKLEQSPSAHQRAVKAIDDAIQYGIAQGGPQAEGPGKEAIGHEQFRSLVREGNAEGRSPTGIGQEINQTLLDIGSKGTGEGVVFAGETWVFNKAAGAFELAVNSTRTYIVYTIRNAEGKVLYVGRASGYGTFKEVLEKRKSSHFFKGLGEFRVEAVQSSRAANRGAEDVIFNRERLQAEREGRELFNTINPISPRNPRARSYIDAYVQEGK